MTNQTYATTCWCGQALMLLRGFGGERVECSVHGTGCRPEDEQCYSLPHCWCSKRLRAKGNFGEGATRWYECELHGQDYDKKPERKEDD